MDETMDLEGVIELQAKQPDTRVFFFENDASMESCLLELVLASENKASYILDISQAEIRKNLTHRIGVFLAALMKYHGAKLVVNEKQLEKITMVNRELEECFPGQIIHADDPRVSGWYNQPKPAQYDHPDNY